ncbi:hypothetical protein ALC62_04125 [Cyphomyrmex costatus]|uniref:Uncharacterized protein n=1 Tax=Cyphomyrmex costatus TaxID=456900 RepID=A0A151IKK1_9HYME|nr:hypothetical protein ALC62_04125 [Cyphomyrmex costatus]
MRNCLRSIKLRLIVLRIFIFLPSRDDSNGLLTKTLLPRAFETDYSSSIGGLHGATKDYKRQAGCGSIASTPRLFYCRGAEETCSSRSAKTLHQLVASGSSYCSSDSGATCLKVTERFRVKSWFGEDREEHAAGLAKPFDAVPNKTLMKRTVA